MVRNACKAWGAEPPWGAPHKHYIDPGPTTTIITADIIITVIIIIIIITVQ